MRQVFALGLALGGLMAARTFGATLGPEILAYAGLLLAWPNK